MNSTAPDESAGTEIAAELAEIAQLLQSEPTVADVRAAQVLETSPDHPRALLLQGISRRLVGNAAGAVDVLSRLCRTQPDDAHGHMQLGLALREAGQIEGAAEVLRRAAQLDPDLNDAWRALAELHLSKGDSAAADEAFTMYARHSDSDPRLQRPAAALRENRLDEAQSMLRAHLGRYPNDIVALAMLGDVAMRNGRFDTAESLLASCLEIAPSYTPARHNLAMVLLHRNRFTEALDQCHKALGDDPNNADLLNIEASILAGMGRLQEAIEKLDVLLSKFPERALARMNLGHALRSVGRLAESIAAYRAVIQRQPRFGEPYWHLANIKTVTLADAEIEAMQAHLKSTDTPADDRVHFHFALGKALEDRGSFEESFHHYAEGNRIRRGNWHLELRDSSEYIQSCKSLFSKEFFFSRADAGCTDESPIFVVGLPRSGSTLIEQILSSHSAVEGTTELPYILDIVEEISRPCSDEDAADYPKLLAELEPDSFAALGKGYLERAAIHRNQGRARFTDKMPKNFVHVGLIQLILPRARIIDVRRHPLASGMSNFKHLFARGRHYSYSLEDIAAYYRNYVELMTHFDTVLPGRVHRVYYEHLVTDTELEVRRLLDYCGLQFEAATLEFYKTDRSVNTPSAEQVRMPVFHHALGHWRNYEPWLEPLKSLLADQIESYPYPLDSRKSSR